MSSPVRGASGRGQGEKKPELRIYRATRRACDCCRVRKIRCDSLQPCNNCRKSWQPCLYLHVSKKSGPRSKSTRSAVQPAKPQEKDAPLPSIQEWSPTREHPPITMSIPSEELFPISSGAEDIFENIESRSAGNSICDVPIPSLESNSCTLESLTYNSTPLISCAVGNTAVYNTFLDTTHTRLVPTVLLPFLELFFRHLFPIMPVLDREFYLSSLCHQETISSDQYCLLTAVSAVTIVQLNLLPECVEGSVPGLTAAHLVEQCLQERRRYDYIDGPTTSTILTSFFLFGYYGNLEKHNKARHHLHEAISFAEVVGLDDENYLSQLALGEGQWCRRVFWLLFITERAYALQRQNHVRLRNTAVKLPSIFQSEDPRLLYGFVDLANLFLSIDETFVAVWNGRGRKTNCSKTWLIEIQHKLSASAVSVEENIETQELDISISRRWLQVLGWQISCKQGLLTLNSQEEPFDLRYPIELARDVVQSISTASQSSLDSHGIGMEQKLADVANCLSDVLKCAKGDVSDPFHRGREYLFALLYQLSCMRGVPSRYLQPLLEKTDTLRTESPHCWPSTIAWDLAALNSHIRNEQDDQHVDMPHEYFADCVS